MRRSVFAAALAATVVVALPGLASADPGTNTSGPADYAVIGDTPYGKAQVINFPNDIAELNAAAPDVVVHLGDIKNGSSRCNTSTPDPSTGSSFSLIKSDFDQLTAPLAYTPGDNEWTDCHRTNNGGYTPTERLATIRSMFFPVHGQMLGGKPVAYQSDAYPENVSWMQSSVEFGLVDVPGSNNDWLAWFDPTQGFNPADDPSPLRSLDQIAEVQNRTAADLDWIDHIFTQAQAHRAKAVVIGIQADMWDPAFFGDPNVPASENSDHFTPIVQKLAAEALKWDKPVLLMNGDSHKFTDDHPFADPNTPQNQIYGLTEGVPNIERVTTNGSTTKCHEWLQLHIDPSASPAYAVTRHQFARQPWGPGDASLQTCAGAVQVF
jgi:hypothetical protein